MPPKLFGPSTVPAIHMCSRHKSYTYVCNFYSSKCYIEFFSPFLAFQVTVSTRKPFRIYLRSHSFLLYKYNFHKLNLLDPFKVKFKFHSCLQDILLHTYFLSEESKVLTYVPNLHYIWFSSPYIPFHEWKTWLLPQIEFCKKAEILMLCYA